MHGGWPRALRRREREEMLVSVQVGCAADGWKCDCGTWERHCSWEGFSVLAAYQSGSGF